MKSYVTYLEGLYRAMFVDIARAFPLDRKGLGRDSSRLCSLIEQRGLPFLTVDLPAMGKHFDQCLAHGRLTPSGIPGFRPVTKGATIPRLFKGMWLCVFDEFGLLRVDADKHAIRCLRQLLYAAKKVKIACPTSKTWNTVNEYFQIDREARLPSLNWDEDELRIDDLRDLNFCDPCVLSPAPLFDSHRDDDYQRGPSPELVRGLDTLQGVSDIVSATLGSFDPEEWRTKHGPGAVADQRHTQFKYDFPCWPAKLDRVFDVATFAFANFAASAAWSASDDGSFLYRNHEPSAKMIAVPKTYKGPRLIAAEPVAHQWCQQSILDFLTSRLANTPISRSIHFRDQSENQEFARRASHTGSHATIDLSSASDRLTCWTVERSFRRNPSLVLALHASRTRSVSNDIDKLSPQFHKLRKFACMGSACTFPVQSYVFCMMAVAAVLCSREQRPTITSIRQVAREVRVFGDDIIIPTDAVDTLLGILGHLGLKVNLAKTFVSGKFRESCGLDAWDGDDVTPTYSMTYPDKSRPESVISAVATHNNFAMRGWWSVCSYIKSRTPSRMRTALAKLPTGSGLFGWFDTDWEGNDHLERRYNPILQRVERRALVVRSGTSRHQTMGESQLLQFFTEARPVTYLVGDRIGIAEKLRTNLVRRWVPESSLGIP